MDANGQRFWLLADAAHWQLTDLRYDAERRSVRLASTHAPEDAEVRNARADEDAARARLSRVAMTCDGLGTRAWWNAATREVRADGAIPSDDGADLSVRLFTVEEGQDVTDLALGYDGILYMAVGGAVMLRDLRDRWNPIRLQHPDLEAWRLAADPAGGVWVLDGRERTWGSDDTGPLWRIRGTPWPSRPYSPYAPTTLRPCGGENPDPASLSLVRVPTPEVDDGSALTPIALACAPSGRLAVLTWAEDGQAYLHLRNAEGGFDHAVMLRGARYPYDLAWTSDSSVALLMTHLERASSGRESEAAVYPVDGTSGIVDPVGDFHPLRAHDGGPFANGVTLPPHYPVGQRTAPLFPLSAPMLARSGVAVARAAMDSGSTDTVWHRVYVDAMIPDTTSITVHLAATDDPLAEPVEDDWHPHRFGGAPASDAVPRGAWVSQPSELPFHPGLLACPPERGRAGLFTVLIQRANRRVRTLRGRYLKVRVTFAGDSRSTPELAALRAYGSRFSYVRHYLPELYHEQEFGAPAEEVLPPERRVSTPADFLERFIDNFEGILTPLEDRIANAHLLTHPTTTPEESLPWLAAWVGMTFDEAYPVAARRALLASAPQLARERGTLPGLVRALEIATQGGVSGGEIVVLEDFRLRRTFATILGVDLANEEDPLLGGIVDSGNSYVGDTLFLGDENRKEFLALFQDDMPTTKKEDAAIDALFERLAHRVTILVHQDVTPQSLGLIRRVAELETPAHVESRVVVSRHAFMVGVASLVGVDSYLAPASARGPVLVDRSQLGRRDFLRRTPSLDYRLGGGAPPLDTTEERVLAGAVSTSPID